MSRRHRGGTRRLRAPAIVEDENGGVAVAVVHHLDLFQQIARIDARTASESEAENLLPCPELLSTVAFGGFDDGIIDAGD